MKNDPVWVLLKELENWVDRYMLLYHQTERSVKRHFLTAWLFRPAFSDSEYAASGINLKEARIQAREVAQVLASVMCEIPILPRYNDVLIPRVEDMMNKIPQDTFLWLLLKRLKHHQENDWDM